MRPSIAKQFEIIGYEHELARIATSRVKLKEVFSQARSLDGINTSVFDEAAKQIGAELQKRAEHFYALKKKRWQESA